MTPNLRKMHRLAGLLLAVPLILWMITGLLFHVKYRYSEAYEALAAPIRMEEVAWQDATLSPAQIFSRHQLDTNSQLGLHIHPSGKAVYAVAIQGKGVVIDAATGEILTPATEEETRRWVAAAVAASTHAERFGHAQAAREDRHFSSWTGTENPAWAFEFSGSKTVTADCVTGEISQTGALNDWIDLTYRVHYLQWTPWKSVNIALVLIAFPLVLVLAFTGLRLFFGKRDP